MSTRSFFFLALLVIGCSCSSKSKKSGKKNEEDKPVADTVTWSYDITHPAKQWTLSKDLKEISGQTWMDNNHLLAIEDLTPHLYLLRLDSDIVVEKTTEFTAGPDKKFDIEDVTRVDNTIYALWSHGTLYKVDDWENTPQTKELETGLSKENNTEGLCYDPVSKNLLIACKNESAVEDEKGSARSIFQFDLKGDTLITNPFMVIHPKDFLKIADEKLQFFPSAIAVHPITHDIYILSTKETKCMAQFSYAGELKSIQYFDKDMAPQPEGICFSPEGILYISSEGKHGEPAAIFKFNPGGK